MEITSQLLFVQQVSLEHDSIPGNKAAPCVLGNLIGGAGVVQNNLREYAVGPTAHPEIQVASDLSGYHIRIRALGGEEQVDTKGSPLSRYGGEPVFNLAQPLLVLLAPAHLVQQLRHLVTGENIAWLTVSRGLDILVQIGTSRLFEQFLAALNSLYEQIQHGGQFAFFQAHPAFLVPDRREVHATLEVGDADRGSLFHRLHEQQLEQYALAAPRGAAQQNMGNVGEVHCHLSKLAFSQGQHETVRGQVLVLPWEDGGQITAGGNGVEQHPAFASAIGQLDNVDVQGRFQGPPFVLPGFQGDTLITEFPHRYIGVFLVVLLMEQFRHHAGMIDKADTLQLVFCCPSAEGINQQDGQGHTARQEISGKRMGHGYQHDWGNQFHVLGVGADRFLFAPHPHRPGEVQRHEQQLDRNAGIAAQPLPEIPPDRPASNLEFFILGHRESPLSSAGQWCRPA